MPQKYDLIIIGSGPAGASAAIYAGRAKLKTLMLDSGQSGGQIRITSEVVNYPGILNISGAQLSDNMVQQAKSFGVEVLSAEVLDVDFTQPLKKIETSAGTFESVGVIVATGARPRSLGFEGEDTFRGHGVGYCATCDGEFFTGMDVFVVGGGFAAAEEAIFLTRYARKVYSIVREDWFTCSQTIGEEVLAHPGIEVHFNTEVVSLIGDAVPRKIDFVNNKTNQTWSHTPEGENATFGVFVFVGYQPQSQLLQGKLTLNEQGYIPTDDKLQTNQPGVYAAGDIRPKELRQLVTAVSDGAIASTNAEKYIKETRQKHNIQIESTQPAVSEAAATVQSFIDADLAGQLKPVLQKFEKPVTLAAVLNPDEAFSAELHAFLTDFAALSDKVNLKISYAPDTSALPQGVKADLLPVVAILNAEEKDSGIHYHAVPSGHEFDSFILALYNTAGPGQALPEATLQRVQAFSKPIHVQVGMSLSCTMCPTVVQGMQQIVQHNPAITLDIIDVSKFPNFKNQHNIMSVPAILINQDKLLFGKKDVDELITELQAI